MKKMNWIIIISVILIIATNGLFAQQKNVTVTYVGNAGFLINSDGTKILIDALFKGYKGGYNLPQNVADKLTHAEAPFDDVDLILVTHAHGDHISATMVQQHMKNNPNAIFVSTKQTVEMLNARDTLDNFHERRISFNPSKEKPQQQTIKGIRIEAFYLPHGPDSRIINNGYLVSVNGITFFQTGDADFDQFSFDEFRALQLPEKNIDMSFIQHYYLRGDSLSTKFVKEAIGGTYIFPIHYHYTTPSFDAALIRKHYPESIIFEKELQRWRMPEKNVITPTLKGDYLGQPLPGDIPIVFAPGIFSLTERLESKITFSPDGKECYFGVVEIKENKAFYKIYSTKYMHNKWTVQQESPFSKSNDVSDPFLSGDGKKLYFSKSGDIWMVERTLEGWREPQVLPSPINSDYRDGSYTESADGIVYISSKRPDGFGGYDIWRIQPNSNQSLQAENLGSIINSSAFDVSPLIAPDGSYLIFGSERDGRKGLAQLYISFKKDNGEWSSPINMNSCGAKINNETAHHSGPSLSPDGKYLFFRRHEAMMEMDVYWVNARVIEKLRNKVVEEYSSQEIINLKGDYLGQPLPGDIPVVFAPGVVSTDTTIEHGSPTFSPDGNEVFWQSNYRQSGKETQIFGMTMKRIENLWTVPKISPYDSGPVFSVDGKRLYYLPFGEENGEKNGPYFVEKEGESWSQPVCMDLLKQFPEIKVVYNHSFTSDNTIYFLGYAEGYWANFGIYRSELIDGKYAQPELLPDEINVPGTIRNWTPFISPDESYLLFSTSRRNPKTDAGDIYITFRKSDNNWTTPVSLGDKINSNKQERFPSVTPDGKYLFFTRWVERGNEDVMWVSASIIDKLKKKIILSN